MTRCLRSSSRSPVLCFMTIGGAPAPALPCGDVVWATSRTPQTAVTSSKNNKSNKQDLEGRNIGSNLMEQTQNNQVAQCHVHNIWAERLINGVTSQVRTSRHCSVCESVRDFWRNN